MTSKEKQICIDTIYKRAAEHNQALWDGGSEAVKSFHEIAGMRTLAELLGLEMDLTIDKEGRYLSIEEGRRSIIIPRGKKRYKEAL